MKDINIYQMHLRLENKIMDRLIKMLESAIMNLDCNFFWRKITLNLFNIYQDTLK